MITVSNLTKRFGPKLAVDKVSFEVQRGEVLGFLGPNGAGKSTTMRMLTGYITPTEGQVSVGGVDILSNPIPAKKKVGYLPESAPLYGDMSVTSFLRFAAELRGMDGGARDSAVDRVIETCFLEGVRRQSIDTLSKGYRHRTCLAQSLIHDPEILIMDEPTDGLDPNQKHEVRALIKRLGETKTIIFSTHILEEVEAACTRAIIIDQGRVVADGKPDELKARASSAGAVVVKLRGQSGSSIKSELQRLSHVKSVEELLSDESGFSGRLLPTANSLNGTLAGEIMNLSSAQRWQVLELHTEEGRLDEMFREITAQVRN